MAEKEQEVSVVVANHDETSSDLELDELDLHHGMKVQFSTLSLIGLGFSIAVSWGGYSTSIQTSFLYGGTAGVIYTFPIASFFMGVIACGMAELCSAYPSTGGQYHWVYMLAPENYKLSLSYLSGWTCTIAWWFVGCSVCQATASFILAMASLNNPEFESQPYQTWLLYVAGFWLSAGINVVFSKWLNKLNTILMVSSFIAMIITFVTVLACHKAGFRDTRFVWATYTNFTGWKSNGFTFLLSVGNAIFSLLGSDAAAHLVDEVADPAKVIPKAIVIPAVIGFVTAWPFCIALMYVIKDLDAVVNAGFAIVEIYQEATQSVPLTIFLTFLIYFVMAGCLTCSMEAATRTCWTLACDGGVPGQKFFSQINGHYKIPVNVLYLQGTFVCLYGLIMLGSDVAFAAATMTLSVFLLFSYTFPQMILLWRGRDVLPARHFDLGRWGYAVNISSCLFGIFYLVLLCFPSYKDVTPQNMNWVSVCAAGLILIITVVWFAGIRKTYKGPALDIRKMDALRRYALRKE